MPENPIYDFMKANRLTDKDEATFLKEYSDSAKAKELFSFFQANKLTDKDFNTFYGTYLKKKVSIADVGMVAKGGGQVGVSKTPSEEKTPETAEQKLSKLGLNITFQPKEKLQYSGTEPVTDFLNKLTKEPDYIDLSNSYEVGRLSGMIDAKSKTTKPVKASVFVSDEMVKRAYPEYKKVSDETEKVVGDLKNAISDVAAQNAFNKIVSKKDLSQVTRDDFIEAGLEYTKQVAPSQWNRNVEILEGGKDLGDENKYNLEKAGAAVLLNKAQGVVQNENILQNISQLDKETDAAHPKFAVAKAWEIISAYNHKKDNKSTNGWFRTRPSLLLVEKWLEEPELKEMFAGNEVGYEILKNQLKSLPNEQKVFDAEDVSISGGLNRFTQSIVGGIENIGNIFDSDAKRQQSNLNPTLGRGTLTGNYKIPGESNPLLQRLQQLKDKEKQEQLTSNEWKEYDALNKSTKVRSGWDKFKDDTFDTLGQVVLQAALTKGVGAGGKLVTSAKAPMLLKTGISTALISYDQSRKNAVYNFPGDDVKQNIYTGAMTAANILSERIFKDEKVFNAFKKGFDGELTTMLKNLSAQNISKQEVKNLLVDNAIKYGGRVIADANKNAFEEAVVQAADEGLNSTMSASDYDETKALKNIADTYVTTLYSMGAVSLLSGIKKNDRADEFNSVAFYRGVLNPGKTQQDIIKLYETGEITEQEKDEKLNILTKAVSIIQSEPPKIAAQPTKKRAEYLINTLNAELKKEQLDVVTDKNQAEEINKQIEDSEKKAAEIYNSLTPEQEIIKKSLGEIKDPVYKEIAENAANDPQTAAQFMDELKSQATGMVQGEADFGNAKRGITNTWGKTLSDFVAPEQPIELSIEPKAEAGSVGVGGDVEKKRDYQLTEQEYINKYVDDNYDVELAKEDYKNIIEKAQSDVIYDGKDYWWQDSDEGIWWKLDKKGEITEEQSDGKPKGKIISSFQYDKAVEQSLKETPKAEAPTPKPKEQTPVSESGGKKSNKGVIKKARGIEDLTDPRDIVMQYFAGGNKISSSAIKELFGGKDERLHFSKGTGGEQKAKISLIKGDAPTIKDLAHKLWEASGGLEEGYQYTDRDFRDAIESVLQDHNSPTSMSIELVDKYINQAVRQELTEQESKDINDGLIKEVTKYVNELPENQQSELVNLLSKYQDKFGFIDWDAVEKDSNGFDPDILSLTIETQEALDGIIQKNLKSGQSELSDASRQSSSQEKGEEKITPQKKPEETPKTQAKDLADKVRKLKIDLGKLSGGGLQSNPLGLPVAVWNGAMDIIAKTIETGGNIADAIKRGLNYIQKNHRGQWNKKQFNDEVMKELGVRGITVNGEDLVVKDVDKEFAETINGFYSDLEQTILEVSPTDKGTPQAWLKKIGTGDEAKWTGVTDWLNSLPKDQKVTRKEILDWLKENRIQVVEVVNSGKSEKYYQLVEEQKNASRELDILESDLDNWSDENYKESRDKKYELNDKIKELSNQIKEEESKTKDTKFENYQLEGEKENYKEVLVTMPFRKELNKSEQKELDELYSINSADRLPKQNARIMELIDKVQETPSKAFVSSHFDEPNILVHLRMNTRTDSEGNKVLFLEEVQSDWGQKGKKEGFKVVNTDSDIEKKFKEQGYYTKAEGEHYTAVYDNTGKRIGDVRNEKLAQTKRDIVEHKEQAIIPSAPFVTETPSWTKLGLKVALKEAVKQGEQLQRAAFEKLVNEKMDWVEARMKKLGKLEVKCP